MSAGVPRVEARVHKHLKYLRSQSWAPVNPLFSPGMRARVLRYAKDAASTFERMVRSDRAGNPRSDERGAPNALDLVYEFLEGSHSQEAEFEAGVLPAVLEELFAAGLWRNVRGQSAAGPGKTVITRLLNDTSRRVSEATRELVWSQAHVGNPAMKIARMPKETRDQFYFWMAGALRLELLGSGRSESADQAIKTGIARAVGIVDACRTSYESAKHLAAVLADEDAGDGRYDAIMARALDEGESELALAMLTHRTELPPPVFLVKLYGEQFERFARCTERRGLSLDTIRSIRRIADLSLSLERQDAGGGPISTTAAGALETLGIWH